MVREELNNLKWSEFNLEDLSTLGTQPALAIAEAIDADESGERSPYLIDKLIEHLKDFDKCIFRLLKEEMASKGIRPPEATGKEA